VAKASKRNAPELTGQDVIDFCHTYLRVPEGAHVGKPVELRPWQQDIIRGIYDGHARRAIISFPRKSGKTALASMILLAHLVGPASRQNASIYSAAQSREQAGIVFGLAAKMVRMSPDLNALVTIRDARKELFCGLTGVTYRALAAEAGTAYGLSPVLVLHDELGQVRGPRSELYEALETATAAQKDPLSIVISTQAPTDADLLSVLIDDAKTGADPRTQLYLWAAADDADPFSEETIRGANPAFGDFQNAEEVLAMANDAKRMPSRQAEFENLILNRRVEMNAPFIARTVWSGCKGPVPDFKGLPVYGGLDLSETTDLTCFVPVALADDIWHVKPTFWLPEEGLRERARKDRVPYDVWHKDGHLQVSPGYSVEYQWVAGYVYAFCQENDVRLIAFDRWNWRHLRPWLLKAGFSEAEVTPGEPGALFAAFGQGYASMSPALRETESAILNGRIRHGDHPVMNMCMGNAVVQTDPAGNRKLTKAKSHGRIDGAVSLVMAMGVASTYQPARTPGYQMLVFGRKAA
jgi:phage terminase large subunit-like protein